MHKNDEADLSPARLEDLARLPADAVEGEEEELLLEEKVLDEEEKLGDREEDEVETEKAGGSSDAVQLYLRQMGSIPLLSREREIELAKQMEEGKAQVAEAVFSSPIALPYVIALAERLKSGAALIREILGGLGDDKEPIDPEFHRKSFLRKAGNLLCLGRDLERTYAETKKKRVSARRMDLLEAKLATLKKKITKALTEFGLAESHVREMAEELKKTRTRLDLLEEKLHSSPEKKESKEILSALEEIERANKLPAEEIKRLVASIVEGESKTGLAKKEFVEANLRLVVSIAKRSLNRGLQFLDLIQEGNLGLIRAVEKFDYRLGYRFSTYGSWWIRQFIARGLIDTGHTIRIPVHRIDARAKLVQASRGLFQKLGRTPLPKEIAAKMGLPVNDVIALMAIGAEPVSLETPIGEEGESSLLDFVEDKFHLRPAEEVIESDIRSETSKALAVLPPREEAVLRYRFGIGKSRDYTLEELGEKFSLTRERIRQLEQRAIRTLRTPSRARRTGESNFKAAKRFDANITDEFCALEQA